MDQHGATGGGDTERNLFRPGDVVTMDRRPSQAQSDHPSAHDTAPEQAPPAPEREVASAPSARAVPQLAATEQYAEPPQAVSPDGSVTWTASEFIAHHKSQSWYAGLGASTLVIAALVWLVTRDVFASAVIVVGIILLGVYAARKPRQETYTVDEQGLSIGRRRYSYHEFRSFSLVPEGAFAGIEFAPLKRFATYTTVYYDPADEDKILNILAAHLPMEPPRGDLTDQLMRRIHF